MAGSQAKSDALATEDVRRHNLALVARHVAAAGPVARSEIATATGLSRGSVTALTAMLLEADVLSEAAPEPAARRGRRLQKLSITAPSVAVLVLLIDADHVTSVAAGLLGDELWRGSVSHGRPLGDPAPVLDLAAGLLDDAFEQVRSIGRRIADVTIVAFAPVAGDPPIVLADTDLEWGRVDVIAELRSRSSRLDSSPAVHLVADVHVAAAAEFALLDGGDDALYIKSDSGIGGAARAQGALLRGTHGIAAAFGHVAVVPDGPRCECGQRGCLVTIAGPDVLLRAAGLAELPRTHGLTAATDRFVELVRLGDDRARAAWQGAAQWIGRTLNILSLAFDPAVIVVGGFWAQLVDDIDAAFRANRPSAVGEAALTTTIVAGRLGAEAALRGALRAARDRLLEDPLAIA